MDHRIAKCLGCGVFIAVLTGEPVMPVLCKDCEHRRELHNIEPNYSDVIVNNTFSGISSTLTASPSPSPAPEEDEF